MRAEMEMKRKEEEQRRQVEEAKQRKIQKEMVNT